MSPFLTFALSKKEIFGKIKLYTSYIAGKRAENALQYDRVAAIELDVPLFDILMEDAATELASLLPRYVETLVIEGDILRFSVRNPGFGLDLPESPGGEHVLDAPLVLKTMESYVTAETILRWLRIIGYDFPDGVTSALKSADAVAKAKVAALTAMFTPPEPKSRPHVDKASPRRVPPI